MLRSNIKMALASLGAAKVRSFLTAFGVVIGVSSVLIAVSVGQGVKNQVLEQINQLGTDVITVIPGKSFVTDEQGTITGFNATAFQGVSTLTDVDIESIKNITGVEVVSPSIMISGVISTPETPNYAQASIMAATPEIRQILAKKLATGEFYTEKENGKKVIVIGNTVANDVFGTPDPIGRVATIRGEEFIVRGVLERVPESPLNVGFNYNYAIYMPLETGKKLVSNASQINQINIKLTESADTVQVSNDIKKVVLTNHNNQEDFTVIQQEDFMQATDQIFELLTGFVAAIAGISLFVGGVGIMNIMLVSVSERTREIGIRKAVGATNRQIIGQFMVEAIVLSVLGGIFGIILSFIAAYFIRLYTPIEPALSLPVIGLAFGVSVVVGVVFGIAPAIKAASKDPIQALRQY